MSRRSKRARIYTRAGDGGETGFFGGGRAPKDHARVHAYGEVDELNAALGVAAGLVVQGRHRRRIALVQRDLFALGAVLASPEPARGRRPRGLPDLPRGRVAEMESWIDEADAVLPPLRDFVLPGGSAAAAALHVARTVCRRAERAVVALARSEPVDEEILAYMNRLSDWLFTMARLTNHAEGLGDVPWKSRDAPP